MLVNAIAACVSGVIDISANYPQPLQPFPCPVLSNLPLEPLKGNRSSNSVNNVKPSMSSSSEAASGSSQQSAPLIVNPSEQARLMMADPLAFFKKSDIVLLGNCNMILALVNCAFSEMERLDKERYEKILKIFRAISGEVKGVQNRVHCLTGNSTVQCQLSRVELIESYQSAERANAELARANGAIGVIQALVQRKDIEMAAMQVEYEWEEDNLQEESGRVGEVEKKEDEMSQMKARQEEMAQELKSLKEQLAVAQKKCAESKARLDKMNKLLEKLREEIRAGQSAPTLHNTLVYDRKGKRTCVEISFGDAKEADESMMKKSRLEKDDTQAAGDDQSKSKDENHGSVEEKSSTAAEIHDAVAGPSGQGPLMMATPSSSSAAENRKSEPEPKE